MDKMGTTDTMGTMDTMELLLQQVISIPGDSSASVVSIVPVVSIV